eukprot:TRINITY_DN72250_c0_g1_i1.p1 TRINITY_DN72250_c0_g1~~TRINITY_DN72250_c0_g1_i1.p1  ORF type:complete len:220 (+),score=4.35 TRINITY_DN72250_c0_g1_i1:185-844(+)
MANLCDSTVSCEVTIACGEHISVTPKHSWTISSLREHLQCTHGIPEYEQHFAYRSRRLRSDDIVCSLDREDGKNRVLLTLMRDSIPKRFSHSRTKRIWEAFLAFSSDYGDSIDGMKATHVAQFADMYQVAQLLASSTDLPHTLNFCEIVDLFASLVSPSPMKTDEAPLHDEVAVPCVRLNRGHMVFVRARAVERCRSNGDHVAFSEFDSDPSDETDASM